MTPVILVVLGFATLLLLVSVLVPVAKRLQLPFTVLLALVGAALGLLAIQGGSGEGALPLLVKSLGSLKIPAEGFLYVFLPPLLFAGGLTVDVRRLFDDIAPVLVLAIIAVGLCTVAVGFSLHFVSGTALIICMLLGAIVATTDTAAVLGIFRDIGAPSRLTIIVEGESLFNDAAAIALFVVLLEVFIGHHDMTFLDGMLKFAESFIGGIILGYVMAQIAGWVISQMRGAAVTEITISVGFAYLTFVLGHEKLLDVSGIIAVVTAAMVFASDVRTRLAPGTWDTLLVTWRQLEFWATSLIFVLAAMYAPEIFDLGTVGWTEAAGVVTVFFAALIARAIVLWGMLPALSWFGLSQPISNAYKAVLCWGSLRGAVTVALALLGAAAMSANGAHATEGQVLQLTPEARFLLVISMGYVLATLFIAAPTLRPLMKMLRLDKLTEEERLVRDRVMAMSRGRVRESLVRVAAMLGMSNALSAQHGAGQKAAIDIHALHRDDLVRAGLIVVSNRETELSLEYLQRGLVGRTVAERMRADAGRISDGVRQNGNVGYLSAALRSQRFGWQFKAALWMQRRMSISWPLAEEIANRFELFLVKQLMLRELSEFCDTKVAELIGQHAGLTVREAIDGRLQAINAAIETLDLQYPDFTRAMRSTYLERLALGLEEAEYRGQLDQSLISEDVFESLEEDRHLRRREASSRPNLDLGLRLTEMLGKVPIFSTLKESQIAQLAGTLTPELFPPGERIIRAGEQGDRMYFIASGTVEVLVGAQPIALKAGNFFGEMALLTDKPRNADVISAGYTNLLVLNRQAFETLLKSHAGLREKIVEIARLREEENAKK